MKKKSKSDIQAKPFVVKIELVEGCNLFCKFCGIKSIRKKTRDFKFLKVETAKEIMKKMVLDGWNKNIRFELAMHGEPTFNPDLIEILSIIRGNCPDSSILIMSNGGGIHEGKIKLNDIMKYINILALDDYKHSGIVPKILKKVNDIQIEEYPGINIYKRHNKKTKMIVVVKDISNNPDRVRGLHNSAGNASELDFCRKSQRCARPFREIAFNHNGDMLLCCNDWKNEFKVGNIKDFESINDLWNHKDMVSARRILFHFGRKFSICKGCNDPSSKLGLLPDIKASKIPGIPKTPDLLIDIKYKRRTK